MRRALVCQHRFPEHDRERGSLRVLEVIDGLLAEGWHVTFASTGDEPAPRYERELARRGVPSHIGWGAATEQWVRDGRFEVAVVAFWHVAEHIAPDLRSWSPGTTIIVDSIDLHFVREARRRVVAGPDHHFDEAYGDMTARELEVYRASDGVLCVSDAERRLLDGVLGIPIARTVELGEDIAASPFGPTERHGFLFVGNFRHLPNLEALSWLCREVVPLLDPELLGRHPLRVVGHAVDDRVRSLCSGAPGVELVGWVPSVVPEIHRARVSVVPLRHGAGVKGKTLQSLMAGTPVVSTPIGVEGIDLTPDGGALVRSSPPDFAAAITLLATDDEKWSAVSDQGRRTAAGHDRSVTTRQLVTAVDDLLDCRVYRPDPMRLQGPGAAVAPELAAALPPGAAAPQVDAVAGTNSDVGGGPTGPTPASISVVIATYERADLLDRCLASLHRQRSVPGGIEVVVVDDGSADHTTSVLDRWAQRLRLVHRRIEHGGRSAAKNAAIGLATAPVLLLLDDDDELTPDACARHLAGHADHPGDGDVILGHTSWAPDIPVSPFMAHVTEEGQQLFSYPSIDPEAELDWRHFWEGRLSIKAALVDRAIATGTGLHDERLEYTIDIEWAYRLQQIADVAVHYRPDAVHHMVRPVALDDFCRRARAKGRAQWQIAQLHPDDVMRRYCRLDLLDTWPVMAATIDRDRDRVIELEARIAARGRLDEDEQLQLDALYRRLITAHSLWGMADARADDLGRPSASVVIPVWSAVPELVTVAQRTVDRVREVSEPGLEIVIIDNGSPHGPTPTGDIDVRNPENLGVAPAWNQGARIATGEVVIVLNSDCLVEPGWDRALRHAAIDGRRIAFPFTDHADGAGPRRPDQAGTAGWCFALRRELFEELGPFDTGFAPAFFEDTDYWHRAWANGVELTPVPAAVVHHERRTTARHLADVDSSFTANRRRYEAKHDLPLDAVPPFWHRRVFEYPPPASVRLAATGRPEDSLDPDDPERPRVFGIGWSKTGTSSLHAALAHLGFRSVHHGEPAVRDAIAAAIAEGRAPLVDVDVTLDAFCDVPAVVEGFAALDEWYPGSRFVLTVRDLDDLVDSHHRHAARNRALRDAGQPHGAVLDIDEDRLRAQVQRHNEAVTAHFADHADRLLVLDICAHEGWEGLAPFVGWQRLPDREFPWENAGGRTDDVADVDPPERSRGRVAIP